MSEKEQCSEPGAYERAAFEAAYRNGCAEVTMRRNRDGRYEHDVQNTAWRIWQAARAAQSGQRAGVAEDVRDAARYRWLRHADLDALAAANWGEGEVYEGEAFDAAIDSAMLAAGTTMKESND